MHDLDGSLIGNICLAELAQHLFARWAQRSFAGVCSSINHIKSLVICRRSDSEVV